MFKVCPQHGEFQQWVERCPECGGPLQLASSDAPPVSPGAEADAFPPAHELHCLQRGDPRALAELAHALQDAGISCRIDPYPPDAPIQLGGRRGGVATTFGLYILPADGEDAAAAVQAFLQRTVPEMEASLRPHGAELHACPACGESLADGARECASCGLAFPEVGEE